MVHQQFVTFQYVQWILFIKLSPENRVGIRKLRPKYTRSKIIPDHKWQKYDVLQNHLPVPTILCQNSSDIAHSVGLEAQVPLEQVYLLLLS